jgi:hypothetical protein
MKKIVVLVCTLISINLSTATFTIDGTVQAMPFSQNYWSGEAINIQAGIQPN